uniref:Protein SREK1IP1 n=1 Tax=Lygus hesperus TaxID=30085 RepID=A0A0K8S4C5_LYGHE
MESDILARLVPQGKETVRPACRKCGYAGHLTYQCRNFIKIDPNKDVVLDVSSTSSESDDEYVTPLRALREQELLQKVKGKKVEKKVKKKKKKKSRPKSDSDSDSDSSDEPARKSSKKSKKRRHSDPTVKRKNGPRRNIKARRRRRSTRKVEKVLHHRTDVFTSVRIHCPERPSIPYLVIFLSLSKGPSTSIHPFLQSFHSGFLYILRVLSSI